MSAPGDASRGDEPSAARARGPADRPRGLCARCRHVRILRSERSSTFLLCTRSKADRRFPKYPPQPVLACMGFEE